MCPSTLERLMRHFQWLSKSECVSGRIMTGQWYRPSRGISFLSTDEKSPIWNDQKSITLKSLNFRGPELFYMSFQNEWLTFIVTSRSPFNIGLAYVGVSHKLRFCNLFPMVYEPKSVNQPKLCERESWGCIQWSEKFNCQKKKKKGERTQTEEKREKVGI